MFLMTLTVLSSTGEVFCETPLQWGCLMSPSELG